MLRRSHFLILLLLAAAGSAQGQRHAYHQTLVMKMLMAVPDSNGSSIVYTTIDKALALIRETDELTLQAPKIIYLVGWQYNGHDDKYPAFFEVNSALKRLQDRDARESLLWLMREAKRYHTTVSLHINMTDAYADSPLWDTYVHNDLISKNADGSLMVVGNYNNRKAYQINYRNEWLQGYAQKRIDRLLAELPLLKEAGTIHLDAWIARDSKGHNESMVREADYQREVCRYWTSQGIDVTSEWVMDYMEGLVPYYWHFNHRVQADYLRLPASQCIGSHMNPDLRKSDFGLEFLFGTSMYGENLFPNKRNNVSDGDWQKAFCSDFYLNFLQYHFLNRLRRDSVAGTGNQRVAFFSEGVKVNLADSTVHVQELLLRKGSAVCFPVGWKGGKAWAAYSTQGTTLAHTLPDDWENGQPADIFSVTKNGLVREATVRPEAGKISLRLEPRKPIYIVPSGKELQKR